MRARSNSNSGSDVDDGDMPTLADRLPQEAKKKRRLLPHERPEDEALRRLAKRLETTVGVAADSEDEARPLEDDEEGYDAELAFLVEHSLASVEDPPEQAHRRRSMPYLT